MRAFLDTNVVLAAFLAEGVCQRLFRAALFGSFEALISTQVLEEAERNLRRKFKVPDAEVRRILALVREVCEVVPLPDDVPQVCEDADDDAIVAAAVAAGAELLVSGNGALLGLRRRGGMRLVAPAPFLRTIESG